MHMFQAHREAFLAQLAERDAAGLVFSGEAPTRNHDCEYIFRPHSDFFYLTGFREPSAALLLLPNGEGTAESPRTVLFLREKDPLKETWDGRRLGVDAAPEALGVDLALPIDEVWDELFTSLKGYERLISETGHDTARDAELVALLDRLRRTVRGGVTAPGALESPRATLHELRLCKDDDEVALMRRGAEVTHKAFVAAMAQTAPGKNEAEINALLNYEFVRHGGTGAAYNNIVAGGDNACILHYIENDMELADGDLLLIDAGCEWDFYATDVTRTFPVGGTFTDAQKELYQVVLDSQMASIDEVRPGNRFDAYHETATRVLAEGLVRLGIIEGPVEKALEERTYVPFTIHKTGHWLGLDVHDQGSYAQDGAPRPLEPGMVLTVEPGIYIPKGTEGVDAKWHGIGIRIEDDILVTESGNENLTASIPKTIADVEAACAAGAELAAH